MGSFNLQCEISGETIGPDDEVISFFVEPVLNKDGNVKISQHLEKGESQYVISSLPVYGRYADYGRIQRLKPQEEPLGNQLATEVSKALYDYDYSSDDVENYREHFCKGGGKSFLDTNTRQKVIKIESYNAIWSEVKDKDLAELLEQGKIKEAFDNRIDNDLLSHLESLKDVNPVEYVGAAQIVRAFKELNIDLGLKVKIAGSFALRDAKLRKSMHDALSLESEKKESAELFKYTCMISGNALSEGEKVYVVPLVATHSMFSDDSIGMINDRDVCGFYSVICSPIESIVDQEGNVSALNMSERQLNWMKMGMPIDYDATKETIFNDILAGNVAQFHYGNDYPVKLAMISETAYKALNLKESDLLKKEYALLEGAAKVFDEAAKIMEKDPVKARNLFENSDFYPKKEALDLFLDNLEEDMQDEDRRKYHNANIGRAFKYAFYSMASSSGNGKYDDNVLMDLLRADNSRSFVPNVLRSLLNKKIMHNETGKTEDVVKLIGKVKDEISLPLALISKLDKFGIGLQPAREYEGTLSASEQRKLNREIKSPSIEASMKRLRDEGPDYGL